MAMDLPKGIVVNSPGISNDVERINTEPVASEIIAQFWKVYTTTKRTLRDPTAERLENYWWRIWGSRKRELRGATVAQLFLYISDGSTFNGQPLLSKFKRFEGDQTTLRLKNGESASGDTSVESSSSSNVRPSSSPRGGVKKSMAPMPHPILKKSRGPSNTGPRPTARFVSPHGSEDERENEASNSSNEHVVIRPPTPDLKSEPESKNLLKVPQPSTASKKKGKGHPVATVAGKRRPAMVRRKSSQSAGEEQEAREKKEKRSTSGDRSPLAPSRNDGGSSRKVGSGGGAQQPKPSGRPSNNVPGFGVAGPGPSTLKASENARLEAQGAGLDGTDLNEEELNELEVQKLLLAEAKARKESRNKKKQPTGGSSQVLRQNLKSMSLSNLKAAGDVISSPDVKGQASVAPGYTNVTGEINVEAPTSKGSKSILKGKGKGKEKDLMDFPKRIVPSLSTNNASINKVATPLSKSQSHLALLLQQDRVRTNEQPGKKKDKEKPTETGSEDTQDEGLFMAPAKKR